ncbi:21227_t:CDS:2 [Rhizophagus irregularis]|nr:21227_t:CDS:2 [Rhizophagus irregularis]
MGVLTPYLTLLQPVSSNSLLARMFQNDAISIDEVANYLALPKIHHDDCPLTWWRINKTRFIFSHLRKFSLSQRRKSDSATSKSKLPNKSLKRLSLATNKSVAAENTESSTTMDFNSKRSTKTNFFSTKKKSSIIAEEQSQQSQPINSSIDSISTSNEPFVSFSEVGDRNGFPVFVFLGMGCVRYFIAFFDDLAKSYNLRLICPDRPGIGLSDDVKAEDQQVLKWPDVIEELCDIMEIPKFFIMAHSAGAPYALACAMKIPQRLQGTIYLVSPWVSTTVANNFKWLQYVPTPIIKFTNSAGISLQQMKHGRQPYSIKPRSSGALSVPTNSEKKQQLGLAILKASFAENLAGANNDLLMCFERKRTFGFSYADVNHPVHVFHGTKDDRIPISAVKWMEGNMTDCKLTLIEGGKHSLFLRAEVVDSIFKSIAVQLHDKSSCRLCRIFSKCWLLEEAEFSHKERELEIQRKVFENFKKNVKRKQTVNMMKTGTSNIVLDHQRSSTDKISQNAELLTVYSYI